MTRHRLPTGVRLVTFDFEGATRQPECNIARVLPSDARTMLIEAAAFEPKGRRKHQVAEVTRIIKNKYPQFFKKGT